MTRGVDVSVNAFWKHSRIKQYIKEGRAWRIETVVNAPNDLGVQRRLHNLDELQAKARAANRRILDVQRAGQGCAIGPTLFERIQQPYTREGQRTGALRFGDPRAMALAGALCLTLHAVTGVTNRSLRALVAALLGASYSATQASYDLRKLRLHGLIRRIHGRNRHTLTDDGVAFAVLPSPGEGARVTSVLLTSLGAASTADVTTERGGVVRVAGRLRPRRAPAHACPPMRGSGLINGIRS